jgi:hypothetical protein
MSDLARPSFWRAAMGAAVFGLLVHGATATAQDDTSEPKPPAQKENSDASAATFAAVVEANFSRWDLNHDGRLESKEIDLLMNRANIHGDAAAALASIKRRERRIPAGQRGQYAPEQSELLSAGAGGGAARSLDSARGISHAFHFEADFRHNRHVLATLTHKLYAGDGPNFEKMHQGPIGDCYFFSLVGYLAARDPQRIVRMIQPEAGGNFIVHFYDGENYRVPAPSDAEILINNSAVSLEDGIWLAVLEKALGERMRRMAKPEKRTAEAIDSMAAGGTTSMIIHLFGGHTALDISLRKLPQAQAHLAELRHYLPLVLSHRMLASLTVDKPPPSGKVPHLGYDHAYAILAFNPETDRVTIWNPWGNTVTPKGPEGLENGFVTKHGVFEMPLTMMYEAFSDVYLETPKAFHPKVGGRMPRAR